MVAILVASAGTLRAKACVVTLVFVTMRSHLPPCPGGIATGWCVHFMDSHSTLNYFSDSAFWHVPLDFKKMEEERGVEII
jgi:hypothetical protein